MQGSGSKHYPLMSVSPSFCFKLFSTTFVLKLFLKQTFYKRKFHSKTPNSYVSVMLAQEFATFSMEDEYENRILTMGYFCLLVRFVYL